MFFRATVKHTKGEPIQGAKAEMVSLYPAHEPGEGSLTEIPFSGKRTEMDYTTYNIRTGLRQTIVLA